MSYGPISTKSGSSFIESLLAPIREFKEHLNFAMPSLSENKEFSWTDRMIQSGKELILAIPFVKYFCEQESAKDVSELKALVKDVTDIRILIRTAGYSQYFSNNEIIIEKVTDIVKPQDVFSRDHNLKNLLVFANRLSQIEGGKHKGSACQIISHAKGLYLSFDKNNTEDDFEKLRNQFIDSGFAAEVDDNYSL